MARFKAFALTSWFAISVGAFFIAGAEREPLSRSIYIPVVFSVPPDMASELLIWIGDEEAPRQAHQHTFLFTFFPEKGDRFFPEQVEVRIRAPKACGGSGIDTNFFISPQGILTGLKSLAFDQEEMVKQVRARRRDIRVRPKVVNIRCHSVEATETASAPQSESN